MLLTHLDLGTAVDKGYTTLNVLFLLSACSVNCVSKPPPLSLSLPMPKMQLLVEVSFLRV